MIDENNEVSVDSIVVLLYGGIISNNCVYFILEVLRRIGVGVLRSIVNIY